MKYEPISKLIIKSFYDVYNTIGFGFLEKVYENAMMVELRKNGLIVHNQYPIQIFYDNQTIGDYFADILVEDKIILELKVNKQLSKQNESQLLRYLYTTDKEVGLLLNFSLKPQIIRKVYDNDKKHYTQSLNNKIKKNIHKPTIIEQIIASFYNVYNALGYGFLDNIYINALEIDFLNNGLSYKKDFPINVYYNSEIIGEYSADFIIEDKLIVITNDKTISQKNTDLLFHLLKSTKTQSGLLLNFGEEPKFLTNKIGENINKEKIRVHSNNL